MKLYGAYGANTNLDHVKKLFPEAKFFNKGVIEGFKVVFRGTSIEKYATIEKSEKHNTNIILWELTREFEEILDAYEDYPSFYGKVFLDVKINETENVNAMVYIMNKNTELMNYGEPDKNYLDIIKNGYFGGSYSE